MISPAGVQSSGIGIGEQGSTWAMPVMGASSCCAPTSSPSTKTRAIALIPLLLNHRWPAASGGRATGYTFSIGR
jgi:hypothetical protein